jgi:hemoglobin/transferrin/lactoferrin receptor protein
MSTRIVRRLPLAAGVLVLGGIAAEAQDVAEPQATQDVILEEVVVTAPKEEKPAGGGTAGQTAARKQQIKQQVTLEGAVVTTAKVEGSAIDALAGASSVSREILDQQFQPQSISQVLRTIPGVSTQETARDTATAISIRGLQDFGRVNVLIDGARQNFQRSGHSANGVVYIEPEMISKVEVTRGPTATVYGSGAIGGVVAFDLLSADDILKEGEYAAVRSRTGFATNGEGKLASGTAAVRSGNFDIVGQVTGRWSNNYEDGSGNVVPGSNDETDSKMVKARWRPSRGHEITVAALDYNSNFEDRVEEDGTLYDTTVENSQYTLGYTFTSPTNPLIDFSAKAYYNETLLEQTRTTFGDASFFSNEASVGGVPGLDCSFLGITAIGVQPNPPGAPLPPSCYFYGDDFPIGAERSFDVETTGFDVFNTSRFKLAGNVTMALTYGVDGFRDEVVSIDTEGSGDEFTPSGVREMWGTFVQSRMSFFEIVELIGAVRYDNYSLDGAGTQLSDENVSPKVTLAVTPVQGLTMFGTYAEAFRAPATSETLQGGFHPGFAHFTIAPNAELEPEVARNIEAGVNLKYNNVAQPGDAFRAKFVGFRNKVDNFIDGVFVDGAVSGIITTTGFLPVFTDDFFQYQNIANARLYGFEFEAFYDAQAWFAGVGAHYIRGKNEDTGEGLFTVPADQITLTAGFRALNQDLVAGARTRFVGEQDRFEEEAGVASRQHASSYTAVDLFAEYKVTEITTINLNIDNIFDETFRQHQDRDNSAGLNARVGLTMRLGAR